MYTCKFKIDYCCELFVHWIFHIYLLENIGKHWAKNIKYLKQYCQVGDTLETDVQVGVVFKLSLALVRVSLQKDLINEQLSHSFYPWGRPRDEAWQARRVVRWRSALRGTTLDANSSYEYVSANSNFVPEAGTACLRRILKLERFILSFLPSSMYFQAPK